jgi:hypothetical protein
MTTAPAGFAASLGVPAGIFAAPAALRRVHFRQSHVLHIFRLEAGWQADIIDPDQLGCACAMGPGRIFQAFFLSIGLHTDLLVVIAD